MQSDLSALRRETEQVLGDRRVNGYVIIPRDVVWRLLDAVIEMERAQDDAEAVIPSDGRST